MFKVLCFVMSFIFGTWILLPIGICLFFAVPVTIKLSTNGYIGDKNKVILKYIRSSCLLSAIYVTALVIIYYNLNLIYLKIFIIGSLIPIILGKVQGGVFYNRDNIEEYLKDNKKYINYDADTDIMQNFLHNNVDTKTKSNDNEVIVSYKEVTKSKMNELSLSLNSYYLNRRRSLNDFFSIFSLLTIKQGYILTSFQDKNGTIYPYIKGEKEVYGENEYSNIMNRIDEDDKFSFSQYMDKILYDRNDPNACMELLIFNYYVQLFFFEKDEYGGKIVLTDQEKLRLTKRHEYDIYYTETEKQKILNTGIPNKLMYSNDNSIRMTLMETDASFEVTLYTYKILPNNDIYRSGENNLISYKVLF